MISIIITNFNKSNFIKETLNSIANQTSANYELIFFDDRSTDNSLTILKKFLNTNKIQCKIIERKEKKNKENCFNQITAIEQSLQYCSGSYVSILDADDIFKDNKIKINKINEIIKKKNKKIIYNSYIIKKNEIFINNKRHFKLRKFIYPIFPPTSCLTIEKKLLQDIIKKINFEKLSTCWFDFRTACYLSLFYKNEIYYIEEPLTIYRIDNGGSDIPYKNPLNLVFWKRKFEALYLYCFLYVKNK